MVMGEPRREEYKMQSFDAATQQLLKTALKDPGAVDLEKVANVIVDHSLQDCVFSKEAGRMCYAIIQAESKQAGQSVFRRGLLNRLQQEYQAREQLRARSLQGWVCYVTFICNIFDYLRVRPCQPHPVRHRRPVSCATKPGSGPRSPPVGEQHAHDGPGEPRLRLPLPAGPARQSEQGGGGPCPGSPPAAPCRWTAWCCSCTGSESSWRR
ncbi:MIF4G domain-containing protein isoform X2 [Globicephala melas]